MSELFLSNEYFIGCRGIFIDTRYMRDCKCFETMVFKAFKYDEEDKIHYNPDEYDMARYDTWEEAVKGHEEMCDKWREIFKKVPNHDISYVSRCHPEIVYSEEVVL